jgi:hypothetical protein
MFKLTANDFVELEKDKILKNVNNKESVKKSRIK